MLLFVVVLSAGSLSICSGRPPARVSRESQSVGSDFIEFRCASAAKYRAHTLMTSRPLPGDCAAPATRPRAKTLPIATTTTTIETRPQFNLRPQMLQYYKSFGRVCIWNCIGRCARSSIIIIFAFISSFAGPVISLSRKFLACSESICGKLPR